MVKVRVAVLGAHTYWGAECIRLLSRHPYASIAYLISNENSGKKLGEIYPHLLDQGQTIVDFDLVDWTHVDCLISGLPHTANHPYFKALPEGVRGIDLSADFRYSDISFYEKHYGIHRAPELQTKAVYGLCEFSRDSVGTARIVGVPGCYPTASLLGLLPLVRSNLISHEDIVIDAKSGVSGAGRTPDELHMYCEIADGVHAYRVARHRLANEIELELTKASGKEVTISFTPHMVPMNRGTLVTMYARLNANITIEHVRAELIRVYSKEFFIRLLPEGFAPSTRMVRGSNYCVLNVFAERAHNRIVVIAAIDNVVKGAAGQAIQNMNVMFGLPEVSGLTQQPLFP